MALDDHLDSLEYQVRFSYHGDLKNLPEPVAQVQDWRTMENLGKQWNGLSVEEFELIISSIIESYQHR